MLKKACFIIGPIGATGSPEREHANTFLEYIVDPCRALVEFGYDVPVRADLIAEPGQITTQIIEHLLHDDLVIADLTGHNPNVFYELSLRHAIGKPVVQMGGIPLPFDIHGSRTIPFTFDVREADDARKHLEDQIRRINSPDYQTTNLITEAAAVIEVARSGPLDMARVLRAVQDLAGDVRFLADEVQTLKQRGAYFVSGPTTGPTGPAGLSEMNAFIANPPVPFRSDDAKLVAAGVGYTGPIGPTKGGR